MEDYIWLFNRREYKELTGSILGSLLFHALLFAILASTSIFHPVIGESEKLDILWFYPSAPTGWRTGPAEKAALAPAKEPEPPPLRNIQAAAPPPEKVLPPQASPAKAANHEQVTERKSPPPSPSKIVAAVKPIIAVPEEEQEPETEPEMRIPAAIEPLPEVKAVEPRAENPFIQKTEAPKNKKTSAPEPEAKSGEPQKTAPPVKKEVVAKAVDTAAPPAVKEAGPPAARNAAITPAPAGRQQPAASSVPRREAAVAAGEEHSGESKVPPVPSRTATPPIAGPAKGAETKTAATAALPVPQLPGVPGETKGEALRKTAAPAPAAKPAPIAKAQGEPRPGAAEVKGIYLPPVHGDLKLEITGKDDILQQIKVVVLFHELPKERRNRPMPKAEYRRFRTLSPKLVRTGDSVRQAVIEVAAEGIYEFRVETGSEEPVDASFAVKLYDNGKRAATKPVGNRRITRSESIVKVMMPEGLLWDDDTAFSGSIEDSDSTTKFNSDTGLVWKEYK